MKFSKPNLNNENNEIYSNRIIKNKNHIIFFELRFQTLYPIFLLCFLLKINKLNKDNKTVKMLIINMKSSK